MLYSEKHAPSDSLQERTIYTKNVLKLIAETMKLDERSQQISDYKINNINRVLQSNDYYVGHEYLEAINDPVYVSEFIERAQKQGCAYIGDETLNRSFITWLHSSVENNIRTLAGDNYIDKKQYYDYVYDTQFRMALLTKGKNESKISHDELVQKKVLDALYFNNALDEEPGVPPEWTNIMHISIQELMDTMNENLTVERTKDDGTKHIVSSEQYLDESIAHIQSLGYFGK